MLTRKRIYMPVLVVILLILLLGLIGWLAFRFFGLVAHRAMPLDPYYAVTTAGVQRVAARVPVTRDEILLPEQKGEPPREPDAARLPPQRAPAAGLLAPAVCTGYEPAILDREAWPNPLTHVAAIYPDRVIVHIVPPMEDSP